MKHLGSFSTTYFFFLCCWTWLLYTSHAQFPFPQTNMPRSPNGNGGQPNFISDRVNENPRLRQTVGVPFGNGGEPIRALTTPALSTTTALPRTTAGSAIIMSTPMPNGKGMNILRKEDPTTFMERQAQLNNGLDPLGVGARSEEPKLKTFDLTDPSEEKESGVSALQAKDRTSNPSTTDQPDLPTAPMTPQLRGTCPTKCVRRDFETLEPEEKQQFFDVFRKLTELPSFSKDLPSGQSLLYEMASLHNDYESEAHRSLKFFPWHRYYLSMFETTMQRIQPSFCLPYYEPKIIQGRAFWLDPVFQKYLGAPKKEGVLGSIATGLGSDMKYNATHPILRRFLNKTLAGDLFIYSLMQATNQSFIKFHNAYSAGPHGGLHEFVGGHMATMFSPLDFLFLLHHTNVDRMFEAYLTLYNPNSFPEPNLMMKPFGISASQVLNTEHLCFVYDRLVPREVEKAYLNSTTQGTMNETDWKSLLGSNLTYFAPPPSPLSPEQKAMFIDSTPEVEAELKQTNERVNRVIQTNTLHIPAWRAALKLKKINLFQSSAVTLTLKKVTTQMYSVSWVYSFNFIWICIWSLGVFFF